MVQFEVDIDWPRMIWFAVGLVLGVALLYVLYRFVGTFVFGLFIYYATRRLYRRVRRWVGQPSLAAGISLVGLALPALLLVGYTIVVALQQLSRFVESFNGAQGGSQLSQLLEMVQPYLDLTSTLNDPTTLLNDIGGMDTISSTLGSVLGYLGLVGTGLLHLFVMFALAFYLLRDDSKFQEWAGHLTTDRSVFEEFVTEIDASFDKVFYGNILNAIITGVIGAIVYSLLNQFAPGPVYVPYAALTGLLTGAASLIPVVGMKLVYVPMTGYLAVVAATNGEGWWFVVVFAAISFVIVDVIPDFMVRPYVSGGKLHTGALMFAYILGPLIFGWYGIFLGPIILVFVSHFARIVLPELIRNEPIQPDSLDPETLVDEQSQPADDGEPDTDDSAQSSV